MRIFMRNPLRVILSLLATVALGAVLMPMVAGAQATTTYTFEACAEGWKGTTSDAAKGPPWNRSSPGHASSFAFWNVPYANPAEGEHEASMTSLAHAHPGGTVNVSFFTQHDVEIDEFTNAGDFLYLEWSSNGSTWKEVHKWAGFQPNWYKIEKSFDAPAGNVFLRFRLTADPLVTGESGGLGHAAIDDVTVSLAKPAGAACAGSGGGGTTATRCTKSGNSGNNTIRGTNRADVLCGKGGRDKLYGRGGKDYLIGGRGRDVCIGGPGRDRFKGCERRRQ